MSLAAVSICNMNRAMKNVVETMPRDSEEYALVQSLCVNAVGKNVKNSLAGKWSTFRKLLLSVRQPRQR